MAIIKSINREVIGGFAVTRVMTRKGERIMFGLGRYTDDDHEEKMEKVKAIIQERWGDTEVVECGYTPGDAHDFCIVSILV